MSTMVLLASGGVERNLQDARMLDLLIISSP
jgi:hypothetical protein